MKEKNETKKYLYRKSPYAEKMNAYTPETEFGF